MLRDRARSDATERDVRDHLQRSADLAPTVTSLESTLADIAPTVRSLGSTLEQVSRFLEDAAMVRVLSPPEVNAMLAEGRQSTDRWLFRGGTGTYIRAVTLPDCVAQARRDRRELLMRLEIIDPTNEQVCSRYAGFRRSLSAGQTDWTLERTQRESYATIVAAAWHRQRYELLDIEVGLSQVMPTLRWDLSSRGLVITNEGKGPALLVASRKPLYDYTLTELRKSFEQARRVPLDLGRPVQLSNEPGADEVVKLFAVMGMPLPSSFISADIEDIIRRALHAENLYDK